MRDPLTGTATAKWMRMRLRRTTHHIGAQHRCAVTATVEASAEVVYTGGKFRGEFYAKICWACKGFSDRYACKL